VIKMEMDGLAWATKRVVFYFVSSLNLHHFTPTRSPRTTQQIPLVTIAVDLYIPKLASVTAQEKRTAYSQNNLPPFIYQLPIPPIDIEWLIQRPRRENLPG
jgi:hypothetical protein